MLNDQQRAAIESIRVKETALKPKERAVVRVAQLLSGATTEEQADCVRILEKTRAS